MPTAANADDGELTEVEHVEMLGDIVHLCLQHKIHRESTNLCEKENYLTHTIYLLVLTLLIGDGCWCWRWRVNDGQRYWHSRTDSFSFPTTQNTRRDYQFIADQTTTYSTPSTFKYLRSWRVDDGVRCWHSQTVSSSLPTTQNTQRYYQFIPGRKLSNPHHLSTGTYVIHWRRLLKLTMVSWRWSKTLRFPDR